MGRLFSLIVIAGLLYGGLYFYYGVSVKHAIEQQLDARGLTALEVERVDYGLLAPASTDTQVSATRWASSTTPGDAQDERRGLSEEYPAERRRCSWRWRRVA
jgi:hypothetical protein